MGVSLMIESTALFFKEVGKEGLRKNSFDLPSFADKIELEKINSFEESDKPLYEECRNEELKGEKHPLTSIDFERKMIELPNGREIIGVFPEFDTSFEMKIDEVLYQESDKKQFDIANEKLKQTVEKDAELRNKFTEEQIEQILEGETPDGYTWHHSEESGVMQLVDSQIHAKTGHTGGRFIWGGGSENR
ncbi:HNH endonuclease [Lutibacter sp. B2]|nr:HNH endonuclease [Lutibacter sp. B2]